MHTRLINSCFIMHIIGDINWYGNTCCRSLDAIRSILINLGINIAVRLLTLGNVNYEAKITNSSRCGKCDDSTCNLTGIVSANIAIHSMYNTRLIEHVYLQSSVKKLYHYDLY